MTWPKHAKTQAPGQDLKSLHLREVHPSVPGKAIHGDARAPVKSRTRSVGVHITPMSRTG